MPEPMTDEQRLAMEYDLDDVRQERLRQQAKWGQQNHPNGTGPNTVVQPGISARAAAQAAKLRTDTHAQRGALTYLDILLEEVFEAAAEENPLNLRAELVQVAAVAVAWVEKIDRDRAKDAS